MKHFKQLGVGLFALISMSTSSEASLILDYFEDYHIAGVPIGLASAATKNSNKCPGDPLCDTTGAHPILGTEREFFVERASTSTGKSNVVSLTSGGGSLDYATANATGGRAMVTWDGLTDNVQATYGELPDGPGLDLDFISDNIYKISMDVYAELGAQITLRFFTDRQGGNPSYTSQTINVPALNGLQHIGFYLNQFVATNGSNNSIFADVRAFQLLIDTIGRPNADATITFLEATSVPEPGALALVGLGLLAITARIRKRAV